MAKTGPTFDNSYLIHISFTTAGGRFHESRVREETLFELLHGNLKTTAVTFHSPKPKWLHPNAAKAA